MFKQIGLGIKYFFKAIRFISKNKLRKYYLYPVAIAIILFFTGFELNTFFTDFIQDKFAQYINFDDKDFFLHQYLNDIFYWIIEGIMTLLFFILFADFYGFIILIIMSPVFAIISEKTSRIINEEETSDEKGQFWRDMLRGIAISIRSMLIELLWAIAMIFVSFIPVIGLLVPVILYLVTSYFYGFSFMDYTCERKKMTVKESFRTIRKNKWLVISIGALYSLVLFIPVIGMFMACIIGIIAVVASTLAMNSDKFKYITK